MKQQKQHCPEVERLMGGRLPFVTRHGITIVVMVLALVCIVLMWSGGPSQQLVRDIMKHTIHQIKNKI